MVGRGWHSSGALNLGLDVDTQVTTAEALCPTACLALSRLRPELGIHALSRTAVLLFVGVSIMCHLAPQASQTADFAPQLMPALWGMRCMVL